MQLKFIKFILRLLTVQLKVHHILVLFAPLLIFFRFNHLIDQADVAVTSLSIGKVAHAESQDKPAEKELKNTSNIPLANQDDTTKRPSEGFEPLTLDENQVRVLQAMAEAQANQEKETDAENEKRKKLIKLGEQKIAEQLDALEKVKKAVKTDKENFTKEEQANITQTAKIYENMKPAAAAEIFNKLDLIVLVQLVKHMNQKKASAIIATMDAKKARALTIELLRAGSPPVGPQ